MISALVILALSWTVGLVHALVSAASARAFGITVKEISFGSGKVLFSKGVLRFRLIPLGDSIRFASMTDGDDARVAFDGQSAIVQIMMIASAWVTLFASSLLILGGDAWNALQSGFSQWILGALSPFGTAQELITSALTFVGSHSLIASYGMAAAKATAINLLPFTGLAGFQAIMVLLKKAGLSEGAENVVMLILFLPLLVMWSSWCFAVGVYAWQHAG